MKQLQEILDKFTDPRTGSLHGAVLIVVDGIGNVIYHRAAGRANFDPESPCPLQPDSSFWVASMTKLATAVAAMQLVEGGVLSLDDDVRQWVPELKNIQVLREFDDDLSHPAVPADRASVTDTLPKGSRPQKRLVLEDVKGRLTLRHLLTHTSGFVYDGSSPLLQQWSKSRGRTAHTFCGSLDGYHHPILFEPGGAWGYGGGVDWAGRVIERVTKTTLENYMATHIWSILGVRSTTFHPEQHRDTMPPQMPMGQRQSVGEGIRSIKPTPIILKYPLDDDLGGIGLFSTPNDFAKLLGALIRGGAPILRPKSVDLLFEPQLNQVTRIAMLKPLGFQMRRVLGVSDSEDSPPVDHCLGGTMTMRDIPSRRRRSSVNWSGLPNLHWWIDREDGIAAALFTQLMPIGDSVVVDLLIELEKALYEYVRREPGLVTARTRL